ncbi:hypothetical protein ES703_102227 [subsurface metagenome]
MGQPRRLGRIAPGRPIEMDWIKLGTRTITLSPGEVTPPPTEGWVKLDTRTITLTPKAPPVPPEEEEVKKFPWTPVIIGAGALVAIVGLGVAARK